MTAGPNDVGASFADVIDLGEAQWDADAIPPRRWQRPWPALLASLAVTAVVLMLGGSASPPWRLGPPLWTLPTSPQMMMIVDGALFTSDSGGGVLTARDLSTGEVRWHIDGGAGWVQAVRPGLVAVQIGGDMVETGFVRSPTAHYIETATGREVSVLSGWPILVRTVDPDVMLTGVPVSCGSAAQTDDNGAPRICTDLVAWSLRTGAQRWRLPYDPAAEQVFSRDPQDTFAELTDRGGLTVRRLATGEVISERHIDDWHPADNPQGYQPVELIKGSLYTAHQAQPDGDVTVTAVAITAEGSTWTRSVPPHPHQPDNGGFGLYPCDRWLCLFDGGGWSVLDLASGAPLFAVPVQEALNTPGFGLIARTTNAGTVAAVTTLTDVSSNRVVGTVHGNLRVLSDAATPGRPMIALIDNSQRTFEVALLYPTGVLATIGVIHDVDDCTTDGTVLICTGGSYSPTGHVQGGTRAWQLPVL
jgi:hypothetical protein